MSLLHVDRVSVQFGGLVALDRVELAVEPGEVVGVIGPNGSGKTTLFNVVTGIYRASSGRVVVAGHDVTRAHPDAIARLGVARTFQRIRLLERLTALDNLLVGYYGRSAVGWLELLRAGRVRRQLQRFVEQARELVTLFSPELAQQLDRPVAELPHIDRRRLEICRAMAGRPRLLLLDEPTAGMSPEETRQMVHDIQKAAASLPGLAIVIIEHDLSVIQGAAQRVVCLNYGRKIAEGSFEQVVRSEAVRVAYLGSDGDGVAAGS
ncbi:MAG TPA: ABC transporter ATP-binding protein [Limnochordales bacterium]